MKFRYLLIVVFTLSLMGCLKQKTLVVVNPNGSGNVIVTSLVSPQIAKMTQSMNAANQPMEKKQKPSIDDDELRKAAAKFGEGVTYVSAKIVTQNGWQGPEAVYQFSDVNKIKVALNQNEKMEAGSEGKIDLSSDKPKNFLTFTLNGEDTKTLTINVPQDEKQAETIEEKKIKQKKMSDSDENSMEKAMMLMMKGLEMRLAVRVNGQVIKNTASHKAGNNEAVLLHVELDKMQKSPRFASILQSSQSKEDMSTSALHGLPGFKFETNSLVEMEFK